jgi:long-chain acyl-CoA synthetase
MKKFDAQQFLALAQRYRVTHTDLSSFQMKFCTNAPFSAVLKADLLKRRLGGLTDYYRMTEGGATCILSAHLRPDKLSTVGQPASNRDMELTTLVDSPKIIDSQKHILCNCAEFIQIINQLQRCFFFGV